MLENGSFKIGRLLGIQLKLHWSFPLLAALVALFNGPTGLLLMLAVFGFVALHELGHCQAARHFRVPVQDITLWPLGGIAQIGDLTARPKTEFWVALAGPAVNLAIALLLTPIAYLASLRGITLFHWLLGVNLVLALFNLIPAFPMDGDRVLRSHLSRRYNNHLLGTEKAVGVGRVAAVLMGAIGLLWDPWLILLAGFIWVVGQQELLNARTIHYRPAFQRTEHVFEELIRGFHPRDSSRNR